MSRRRVRRQAQLDLGPYADFTPHRQLPSDQCSTFWHAAQSVVSLQTLVCEHRRIDPLAIVTYAQPELIVVVADIDLDAPGMRVPEGIPKSFRGNLVDLVTNDRVQISRLALHCNFECGRLVGVRVGREFVAEGPDRYGEIVAFDGRRAQALDRVPAFGDRLRRVFNRTIQLLLGLSRALRQQVRRGLELQEQSVEALQQRVVQVARDACALVDTFVEPPLVIASDLTEADAIARPQGDEHTRDDERFEPARLVVRARSRSRAPRRLHSTRRCCWRP